MEITGILLCGGKATRFGGDKLLAGDDPVAARAARNLRAAVPRVLAVVPLGAARLREVLEREGCEVLETDRTAAGMGASLAAGVSAAARAGGWVVALGDMPALRPQTIALVRDALIAGARIAAPDHADGRRGHPVGFAADLYDELAALEGDEGARGVIKRHAAQVRLQRTDDPGVFIDIDTPEDLAKVPSP